MLKGVPRAISPELMYALMKMGHGDEIVLGDGNFPADSHAQRILRADGLSVCDVLDGLLRFLPLDSFVERPACVMQPVQADATEPMIWEDFRQIMQQHEERPVELEPLERFEFYERARQAYAIVATSETALYANLILKKGVVTL